jgi:hypothetical protein
MKYGTCSAVLHDMRGINVPTPVQIELDKERYERTIQPKKAHEGIKLVDKTLHSFCPTRILYDIEITAVELRQWNYDSPLNLTPQDGVLNDTYANIVFSACGEHIDTQPFVLEHMCELIPQVPVP